MSSSGIQLKGTVSQHIKGDEFFVFIPERKKEIKCILSGKIRKNKIMINPGDTVIVEFSEYNLDLGRIIFREKPQKASVINN